MKLGAFTKQPNEKETYSVTYADALTVGDNVLTATVVVDPVGLTISGITITDPIVKFFATGGVDDLKYKITLTVTTVDGRILEDEIYIKIKEY